MKYIEDLYTSLQKCVYKVFRSQSCTGLLKSYNNFEITKLVNKTHLSIKLTEKGKDSNTYEHSKKHTDSEVQSKECKYD